VNTVLLAIALAIILITAVCLYRVIVGPTVFDRMLAAGLVGTNGLILLVLIGFLYRRIEMFLDIAVTYALLNFIIAIVLGKYFERTGEKPR